MLNTTVKRAKFYKIIWSRNVFIGKAGNKQFAKVSKIHFTFFIRRPYLLVFRAKFKLAGSQPKFAEGKPFLYNGGDFDYLPRLCAAGGSMESPSRADNRIFS